MPPADPIQHIHRLERLIAINRSLGSSKDLDVLLQTVVDAVCELLDSEYSVILMYEEETDLLKFVAGPPVYREVMKRTRVPLDKSVAGWVFKQTKPLHIPDVRNDLRILPDVENVLGFKSRSILAIPLTFRGETIGVIEAINKRNNSHYTEDDVTFLETLASQTAVVTLGTLLIEETEHAYKELEELERVKSNFIAIAAHELRTPLGLILGHATFLSESVKDDLQTKQLDVIIRSATRLKKIVEDLSNVSNVQSGAVRLHRKPIALQFLIPKVAAPYQEAARRKHVSLAVKMPDVDLTVEGDEEKLTTALSNLVDNALIFTNDNGHVFISADKLPGYVKVSVLDDGIGIPAKDLPRVFDRFFQVQSHLTRRHGGMGLGLSVTKAMIELHGGQIWVESIEGKGSNFSFLVPTKPTSAQAASKVFSSDA
jgi:signal transduction histidine kinase